MLLGTLRCMTLFRLVFLFFSDINSVGSQGNSILNFLRNLFSTVVAPTYILTSSVWGFPFLHIFTNVSYLCSFWWQLFWQVWGDATIVLICISLINDVEHFFICLAIYTSLEKCLFSSAHFLNHFKNIELYELFTYVGY